jgi:hypothetical protein
VLYLSPRGNFIQRKMQDIFSGRQGKLDAALECIRVKLLDSVSETAASNFLGNIRDHNYSLESIGVAVRDAHRVEPASFLKRLTDAIELPVEARYLEVATVMHSMFNGSSPLTTDGKYDIALTLTKYEGPEKPPPKSELGINSSLMRPWSDLQPKQQDDHYGNAMHALRMVKSMQVDDWLAKLTEPPGELSSGFSPVGTILIEMCKTNMMETGEKYSISNGQYRPTPGTRVYTTHDMYHPPDSTPAVFDYPVADPDGRGYT